YLASIIQHCDSAIFAQTLDGAIVSWNRGAERLYGYSPSQILGAAVSVLVPQHRLSEQSACAEQLKDGKRVPSFETMHLYKNGAMIPVSVAMSAIRDVQGRVIGFSTIVEDLTRRREEDNERLMLIQDLTTALAQSLDQPRPAVTTLSAGAQVAR